MHFDLSLAGIIFRFTVFGLLLTKIIQISRNYIIPYLLDKIKQERAARTELIEKENFITSTQNKIENQTRNQKKVLEGVERNVQKWHAFLQKEKDMQERQFISTKNEIDKKRAVQRANYMKIVTYNCVVPEALKLAQQEMVQASASERGYSLFNKMIYTLK